MRNKDSDNYDLIRDLGQYIDDEQLDVLDNPLLDRLIENQDINSLIAYWLRENNAIQLEYVLTQLPDKLRDMKPEDRERTFQAFFSRAHVLCELIPAPTMHDLAIQSIPGYVKEASVDGWSSLNRPLFALAEQDIAKLKKYALFINNGIFTANTVLDMNPSVCASFDARVKTLIVDHANFLLPSSQNFQDLEPRIFEDELTALIKKDQNIIDLLAGIQAFQPIASKKPSKALPESEKPHNPVSDEELATLLGYETDDSHTPDFTDFEDSSEKSNASNESNAWRSHNIETYRLHSLIQKGQLKANQIPNRALTEHEKSLYAIMHNMMRDKGYTSTQADASQKSVSTRDTVVDKPLPSKRGSMPQAEPAKSNNQNKRTGLIHKKASDERRPFRIIKSETHNALYKKHLKEEKIISDRVADYTVDIKVMPKWHEEYKKRLQERTQRGNVDSTTPQESLKPRK